MTYIGSRLRYLRKFENVTQQQLADKLGVAKSTISMYENGQREPDFETLEALADFFNVEMRTFFPGNSCPTLTPNLKSLSSALDQLNEEGTQKLLDYAADLVASGRYAKIEKSSPLQIAARSGDDLSKADFSRIVLPDAEDDVPV